MYIKSTKNYREVLASLGVVMVPTKGVSMLPLIVQGDGYVGIISVDKPAVGDILLFEQKRDAAVLYILHRLIRIEPIGDELIYVTRGDNCLNCEKVRRSDIIGRAETIYRDTKPPIPLSWILNAHHEIGGKYIINVGDAGYKRYTRLWSAIWPLRRAFYLIRMYMSRIPLLRRLYHKIWKI